MVIGGRRGTDKMADELIVCNAPGALVQDMPTQPFHIACIAIADIQNKCCPSTQMSAHCRQNLPLIFARSNMSKRTQSNKSQAKLLSQGQSAHILLHQRAAFGDPC